MSELARSLQLYSDLLPEERLLLAIAKVDPSPEDRALAHHLLGAAEFPWREAFALAHAHRVHPILAHNLEADASLRSRVPADFDATLRACRVAAVIRKELYVRAIAPVIATLAAEEIPLVLMKGAALVETVYPHGTRLLNDFDILIHKSDYHKVTNAFVAAGFAKQFREETTEASELEQYHQMALVKRIGDAPLSVDLHWLLYPSERAFCQIDTSTLMSRAERVPFGATSALVLSREDLLVHYASQLVNDSLNASYQRMGDIYAVVKHSPSWESIVDIASRAGSAGATHLALSLASMLGARVPSSVFRRLRRECIGCHLSSRYLAVPSLPFRGATAPFALPILMSLLYSRQRDRLRYLRDFLGARWRVSRGYRGALRSGLIVAKRIAQAARWSVELLGPAAWWKSGRGGA